MKSTVLRNQESGIPAFLSGGEMGRQMQQHDWSQTSLGSPEHWPQSLRTTLGIILHSRFPMFLFWGPELLCFYNDAYRPSFGTNGKHPQALGKPGADVWPEIWHIIKPLIDQVLTDGEATWSEDQLIPIYRNGTIEDVYWTFSYSPVYDESGLPAGVFVTCIETTGHVLVRKKAEENEKEMHTIFLQSSINFAVYEGPDFKVKYINERALQVWGKKKEEVIGRSVFDISPEVRQSQEAMWCRVYETGEPVVFNEYLAETVREGKVYQQWFDFEMKPLRNEKGEITGLVNVSIDVTEKVMARKKLEESESRFRRLSDSNLIGIMTWNLDGFVTEANDVFLQMVGYTRQELLDRKINWNEMTPSESQSVTQKGLNELAELGYFHPFEKQFYRKDGSRVEVIMGGAFYENSQTEGVCWVLDITEKKKAEQATKESEEHFRTFADNIQNLAWMTDGEGWIYWYNQRWLDYTGTTLEEMQGWGWEKVHHPDHLDRVVTFVKEAWKCNRPWELTFPLRGADGTYRWFLTRAVPITDQDGKIYRWIGTNTDIHNQVLSEEELARQKRLLETITNNTPDLVYVFDLNYRFTYANQALLTMWGRSWENAIGCGLRELGYEEWHAAMHEREIDEIVRTKQSIRGEVAFPHAILGKRIYDYILTPVFGKTGEVVAIAGTTRDISDIKQSEQNIRESESRFRSLANDTPAFMFMGDAEANVEFVNRAWLEFVGLPSKEGMGKAWETITHPEDVAPMYEIYNHAVNNLKPYEFAIRQRRHDGQYRWVLWKGIPRTDIQSAFNGIMGVGFDITEQTEAAEQVRQSESRFRTLAETLPQLVWVSDNQRNTEYASRRWQDYSGIEDIQEAWKAMVHPQDWDGVNTRWTQAHEKGESFTAEVRLLSKTGEYRWHTSVAEPVRDASGAIVRWVGAIHDIHDQKTQAEQLEKLVIERTRELQRSNEELQQFAHVASHDLKEPVRKIRLFSNFLASKYTAALPEEGMSYLNKIQDAASRMHTMIDGVLLYSSLSASEQTAEPVDLNQILHTIETDLEIVIKQKQATLRYRNLPVIDGYSVLLYQLFYNLVNNSLKFARTDVSPVITIDSHPQEAAVTDASTGAWVRIRLQDNGIGFRPEDAQNIFKTFVRLNSKDQYEGTGLGLSLCHRIVERHGGTITAEGSEGEGAVFWIDLPVHRPNEV